MVDENDSLMKTGEVANFFRVDPQTIYLWVYYGKIPYSKINASLRFKLSDLHKMVEDARRPMGRGRPGAVTRAALGLARNRVTGDQVSG
jgi:hypothetical protein